MAPPINEQNSSLDSSDEVPARQGLLMNPGPSNQIDRATIRSIIPAFNQANQTRPVRRAQSASGIRSNQHAQASLKEAAQSGKTVVRSKRTMPIKEGLLIGSSEKRYKLQAQREVNEAIREMEKGQYQNVKKVPTHILEDIYLAQPVGHESKEITRELIDRNSKDVFARKRVDLMVHGPDFFLERNTPKKAWGAKPDQSAMPVEPLAELDETPLSAQDAAHLVRMGNFSRIEMVSYEALIAIYLGKPLWGEPDQIKDELRRRNEEEFNELVAQKERQELGAEKYFKLKSQREIDESIVKMKKGDYSQVKKVPTHTLEEVYLSQRIRRESKALERELIERDKTRFVRLEQQKRQKAQMTELTEMTEYELEHGYGYFDDLHHQDMALKRENEKRLEVIKDMFMRYRPFMDDLFQRVNDPEHIAGLRERLAESGLMDILSETGGAIGLTGTRGTDNTGELVAPILDAPGGAKDPVGDRPREIMSGVGDIAASGAGMFSAYHDLREGRDPLTLLKGMTDMASNSFALFGGMFYGKYGGSMVHGINHQAPKYVGDILGGASQTIDMVRDLKGIWDNLKEPGASANELGDRLFLPLLGLTKKAVDFGKTIEKLKFQGSEGWMASLSPGSELNALTGQLTHWSAGISLIIGSIKLVKADFRLYQLKMQRKQARDMKSKAKIGLTTSGGWEFYKEIASLSVAIQNKKRHRFYRSRKVKNSKGPLSPPQINVDPIYELFNRDVAALTSLRDKLLKEVAENHDTPQAMRFRVLDLVEETVNKQIDRLELRMGEGVVEMAGDASLLTGVGALGAGVAKGSVAVEKVGNSIFKKIREWGRSNALKASRKGGGENSFAMKIFDLKKSKEKKEVRLQTVIFDFLHLLHLSREDGSPKDIFQILEALGFDREAKDEIWESHEPFEIYNLMEAAFKKRD